MKEIEASQGFVFTIKVTWQIAAMLASEKKLHDKIAIHKLDDSVNSSNFGSDFTNSKCIITTGLMTSSTSYPSTA